MGETFEKNYILQKKKFSEKLIQLVEAKLFSRRLLTIVFFLRFPAESSKDLKILNFCGINFMIFN